MYFFGVGAVVTGVGPLLCRAPVDAVEAVRAMAARDCGAPVRGPEITWPEDRTWVVYIDYELSSSYVACDTDLASSLLSGSALEFLPVALDTRIDSNCDTLNSPADLLR